MEHEREEPTRLVTRADPALYRSAPNRRLRLAYVAAAEEHCRRWKDSSDCLMTEDGTLAAAPIALVRGGRRATGRLVGSPGASRPARRHREGRIEHGEVTLVEADR